MAAPYIEKDDLVHITPYPITRAAIANIGNVIGEGDLVHITSCPNMKTTYTILSMIPEKKILSTSHPYNPLQKIEKMVVVAWDLDIMNVADRKTMHIDDTGIKILGSTETITVSFELVLNYPVSSI